MASRLAASERRDAVDALAAEARERAGQPRAVRQRERGVELEQRNEHEAPREHVAVRQRQPLGAMLERVEQQQGDVDRPGAVALPAELTAELALDGLALVEELLRPEVGLDGERRVQEV